jgi:putative nucleotidyltransferase with HDIG domain
MAEQLQIKGVHLNKELVKASALLHDITKTRSFRTGENHAQTGEQYLIEKGFPEVGRVVGQHVVLDDYFSINVSIEPKIVNYADKRVLHDRIVSLTERMDYIFERYGSTEERRNHIHLLWDRSKDIENVLLTVLDFSLKDLDDLFI